MPPRDTGGGVVLGLDGKMVLVNQGSDVWSFPKGGIEKGESAYDAAKREVSEECGITDLTLVCELGSYKRRRIGKGGVGEDMNHPETTRTIFLFTTEEQKLTAQDGEIVAVRWVTIDEALELLTHPKDKEFLASVRDKIVA
jgi:8-oxo-dGTP pyrophosphatase MutT (NUDIX family)